MAAALSAARQAAMQLEPSTRAQPSQPDELRLIEKKP